MLNDKVHQAILEYCPECLDSLSMLSMDTNSGRSLCQGNTEYLNFDKVAKYYCIGTDKPETVDMLAKGRNVLILAEFKAGKIHNKTDKLSISNKLLSSLLLLQHVCCSRIETTLRNWLNMHTAFVLVYDASINPRTVSRRDRVHGIKQHLSSQTIRFGLQKYNRLYAQIYTLADHNFADFCSKHNVQPAK